MNDESRNYRKKCLEKIVYGGGPNMTVSEKAKMEIFSSCIEDLEESINQNANSSQSLATKVYYLNIILTIATVAGVILAILQFLN